MNDFLDWIVNNPSAFASLVSAVLAASVAITVFAVTQFLTAKRARTEFLTPKLEELYLLLNTVSEDNVRFFKMAYLALDGDDSARAELTSSNELDAHGHRTAKKIIMYVRLYFPRLSTTHQMLFAAQRELNELLFNLHGPIPPTVDQLKDASGGVGHFLRLIEEEVIVNRDYLLNDHLFPMRYKKTAKKAIEDVMPAPSGPVMNRGNRNA